MNIPSRDADWPTTPAIEESEGECVSGAETTTAYRGPDKLLLDEALLVYAQQDALLDRIDSRATTLQATVGIAAAWSSPAFVDT
jgi:hypothetical protein